MATSIEPSRIREHGTVVTMPSNGYERIAALREIVSHCQYAKVDGAAIDLFSASAIIRIYDAFNPQNQEKYRNMTAPVMAHVAFKITGGAK